MPLIEREAARWRKRAREAEAEVKTLRAAAAATAGSVAFMAPTEGNFYTQAAILRQFLRRWNADNVSELCILALEDIEGVDRTREIKHTVAFQFELKRILEDDRKECANYLATHAYHPGKFLLAKMALRSSGRSLGWLHSWLHSLLKYDHSRRVKLVCT